MDALVSVSKLSAVAAVVYLSCSATYFVVRADTYDASSKALQITIIWLLPVIGAVACLLVIAHDAERHARTWHRPDEERDPSAIDRFFGSPWMVSVLGLGVSDASLDGSPELPSSDSGFDGGFDAGAAGDGD